ncbi:MAG: exosortase-associated EpsI family protein [Planctomycetota bacterium]|nr:exosortase-associated EpsI family protein [Planctomycetota bacterium]
MVLPTVRYLFLVGMLLVALCLQIAVQARVPSHATQADVNFDEIPSRFGDWIGRDVPITNPAFLYGDSHLQRVYRHRHGGQTVTLWMAYSRTAADRWHHPQACMRTAGMIEDEAARQVVAMENFTAPLQQFRFHKPSASAGEWVFYWHYTIPPAEWDENRAGDLPWWKRVYFGSHHRPASMTLEVFSNEGQHDSTRAAREFAVAVDRMMQQRLPRSAIRGSDRAPVFLVRDGGLQPATPHTPTTQ